MAWMMGKAGLAIKMSALGIENGQKSSVASAPCTAFWRREDLWVRPYPGGTPCLQLCREAAGCYPLSCPLRKEPGIPSAVGPDGD